MRTKGERKEMSTENLGTSRRLATKELTLTSMMVALILVMSLTPLGFLPTPFGINISLLPIPVGIGAMLLGSKVGAILGFTFGIMSFSQAFGKSVLSTALFGINPIYTFILSVFTRTAMGFCVGLIFSELNKRLQGKSCVFFISGFMAAFLNTLFYMSTLIALFWNTDLIQGYNESFGGLNPFLFVITFVGVNGVLEMVSSCIIGGSVAKVLKKLF